MGFVSKRGHLFKRFPPRWKVGAAGPAGLTGLRAATDMAMMLEWSLHPQQTVETESMTALRTSHKLLFKIYDRIRDAPAERAALGLPPRC